MTALYEDNAFISWENPAEMTKFYEDLTESDVWISGDSADEDGISMAEVTLLPLEMGSEQVSVFSEDNAEAPNFPEFVTSGIVYDTMNNSALVIKIRDECYPLRNIAVQQVEERAQFRNRGGNTNLKKTSIKTYCKVANEYLRVCNSRASFLLRFGKITGVQGRQSGNRYGALPISTLLRTLYTVLDSQFPGHKFVSGTYCHEFSTATWLVPEQSDKILGTYLEYLKNAGTFLSNEELTPVLKFTTSDVGACAATIRAGIQSATGKYIEIGDASKLEHREVNIVDDFSQNCEEMFAQIAENMEKLVALMDVRIRYPLPCMLHLARRYNLPVFMAAEAAKNLIAEMGGEQITAHDVFWAMNDIVRLMDARDAKGNRFKTREKICRILAISPTRWKEYDYDDGNTGGTY